MNQGDVVWVKLFFSNLKKSKVRPGIIVSNNKYNEKHEDVVICAVTSRLKDDGYTVPLISTGLSKGEMPIESRIRADKIMQIEKSLILSTFGSLKNKKFDEIVGKVTKLIQR